MKELNVWVGKMVRGGDNCAFKVNIKKGGEWYNYVVKWDCASIIRISSTSRLKRVRERDGMEVKSMMDLDLVLAKRSTLKYV